VGLRLVRFTHRACYKPRVSTRKRQKAETVVLTHEEIRACLAEGRLVRAELEKRIEKMHQISIEQRFSQAR